MTTANVPDRLLARLARRLRGRAGPSSGLGPPAIALQQIDIPILYLTETLLVIGANAGLERLIGRDAETVIGAPVADVLPGYDRGMLRSTNPYPVLQVRGRDGTVLPIEIRASPWIGPGDIRYALTLRDVSHEQEAAAKAARLARVYQALSALNAAIRHTEDEAALLALTCRLAVDLGDVAMAWIGIPGAGNGMIRPVARYGSRLAYLDGIRISSRADVAEGQGPTGVAYREGRAVTVGDYGEDESTGPWRERAIACGFRSAGAFPILRRGAPYAVLTVYHGQKDAFDKDTVGVLHDMAAAVSFALDAQDRERQRCSAQQALAGRERHFRAYFEQAAVGMAATSRDKSWLEVNDALCAMLGYTRAELLARTWLDITHPGDRASSLGLLDRLLSGRLDATTCDKRYIHKDGHVVHVHIALRAVRGPDGALDYVVLLVEDITANRHHEDMLGRLARILDESSDEIYMFDARTYRFLFANTGAQRNLGYSIAELRDLTPLDIKPHLSPDDFARLIAPLKSPGGDCVRLESEHRRKDGTVYPIEACLHFSENEEAPAIVAIIQDTTERRRFEAQLRHQATHDALTGLANRAFFYEVVEKAMAYARRQNTLMAVLFVDLDAFKNINDALGHEYGDRLLQAIAKRLMSALRREDWIAREPNLVARQGGDEFTILLQGLTTVEDIIRIAERLLSEIAQPLTVGNSTVHVTASIGITVFPFDDAAIEELLRNADVAMYKAKDGGGNTFAFYDAAMSARIHERREIEEGLRRAIDEDQLVLHYQPQIHIATGRVVGVEALVRWQHPERGLIPPGAFISIAEESRLIVPLGEWVLRSACVQNRLWRARGLGDLKISINLSGRQFKDRNLATTVAGILGETGLDAATSSIELEVTESTLMDDTEVVAETLAAFREMGLRLALDDFGTGYSSLNYLKRFQMDTLKIDQCFVRGIAQSPEDAAITSVIISLGHSLGLTVIAEGVEDLEQLKILRDAGCDEVQGYYYSKPLPAPAFEEWLDARRPAP